MKRAEFVLLTIIISLFCVAPYESFAEEGSHDRLMRQYRERQAKKKVAEQTKKESSIWDDDAAANPYFKKEKKAPVTKKDEKTEAKTSVNTPEVEEKDSFQRRVYKGPSKEEIAQTATKKAIENFKKFISAKEYEVKYDSISYNVKTDNLSINNITIVPSSKQLKAINPYLIKAETVSLRDFNIGEKDETPIAKDGEMIIGKMEIPVWNDKGVKKGKVDVAQLKMRGDIATYLKAKGNGKMETLEVSGFRSETIINEIVLNNIVRSKVFAASSADFKKVELQKGIANALKRQEITGLKFASARVNGQSMPSLEAVMAAMTSYSARILNTDLVLGARLEAEKKKPNLDKEQLKKNAAENKAAIKAVEDKKVEK